MPRGTQELNESLIFVAYGAITLCDGTFQNLPLKIKLVTLWLAPVEPYNPNTPYDVLV